MSAPTSAHHKPQALHTTRYTAARGVAMVAGIFSAIVCVLILASWLQTRAVDPVNSQPLQTLMDRLQEDPGNQELQEQIRALDLLARKAYFTSRWQLRTGGLLLLGGVVVLLLAVRIMGNERKRLPILDDTPASGAAWLEAARTRRWVTASGGVLLGLTMIAALASHSELAAPSGSGGSGGSAAQSQSPWPNFRGPQGNGVAAVSKAPTAWNVKSGKGIAWKVEVPRPGNSSPVIVDGKVFLTGADDKVREVFCYAADSGKLLWRKEVKGIPGSPDKAPRLHKDTGYAAPTMATDGRSVFAIFANGDLIAFDLDGKQLWAKSLGLPKNNFGHASSLIVHGAILVVQMDQIKDGKLWGLDVATGEPKWQVQREQISWSSPICVDTGKRSELITTDRTTVSSYDPKTGAKLWSQECLSGDMGPSAAYADGMVFAANDYAIAAGIRLTGSGSEIAWEFDEHLPDTASPLATKDYVFLAMSYGFIACLDAKQGEMLWEHEFENGFYSSPILVGDDVYATDMEGVVHIFKADKSYQAVADVPIGEKVVTTPAFVDGKIYLRGEKQLLCISGA